MPIDIISCDEDQIITLNGETLLRDEAFDIVPEWVQYGSSLLMRCPYCNSNLNMAKKCILQDHGHEWVEDISFGVCPNCSFWHGEWYRDLGIGQMGCPESEWEAQISKISEYENVLPEGCEAELAQYLRANPGLWCTLDPRRLETLVAHIFRHNYAASEVMHVGRPGDGGVDVVFVDSGGRRWLIQVKRRENTSSSEGVGTLRNLLGVMLLEDASFGAIVSTADHFTYSAHKARHSAEQKGYMVALIDSGKLDRLLEPIMPFGEWIDLIERRKPEWVAELCQSIPDNRQLSFKDYLYSV